MGIVRMGAPRHLILQMAQTYNLKHFIETGTYLGHTTEWASNNFAQVTTIEMAESIYQQTSTRLAHTTNIDFRLGDSRTVLAELAPTLTESAVFWLDGHWSGGETYGEKDQCPLMEEIEAINTSPAEHFIFIDDARLFTSTPPEPHDISVWPNITEVLDALRTEYDYFIVIWEDNIIAVPRQAQADLQAFCQQSNTTRQERKRRENQRTRTQKGIAHLRMGFGLLRRGLWDELRGNK
jgi:hypothetical protein